MAMTTTATRSRYEAPPVLHTGTRSADLRITADRGSGDSTRGRTGPSCRLFPDPGGQCRNQALAWSRVGGASARRVVPYRPVISCGANPSARTILLAIATSLGTSPSRVSSVRNCRSWSSRPVSAGGGLPAPIEKGFVPGSATRHSAVYVCIRLLADNRVESRRKGCAVCSRPAPKS